MSFPPCRALAPAPLWHSTAELQPCFMRYYSSTFRTYCSTETCHLAFPLYLHHPHVYRSNQCSQYARTLHAAGLPRSCNTFSQYRRYQPSKPYVLCPRYVQPVNLAYVAVIRQFVTFFRPNIPPTHSAACVQCLLHIL